MSKGPHFSAKRILLQVLCPRSKGPGIPRLIRHASTNVPPKTRSRLGVVLSGGLLVTLGIGLSPFYLGRRYADSEAIAPYPLPHTSNGDSSHSEPSLRALIRSYVVYTMCTIPPLVDYSPTVLRVLTSIPGVKQITEAFVRITFFDQFVGGDTAHQTVPLLHALRSENKGALFAYSVEVDESEATLSASSAKKKEQPVHKRIVDEMIRCIDVAADFEDGIVGASNAGGRRTWVAVKMTALLPNASALISLSSHIVNTRPPPERPILFPGCPTPTDLDVLYTPQVSSSPLTPEDVLALRELHADLFRICTRAKERGVKIIIDAEYSWYQPALDALTLSLMRQFNKLPGGPEERTSPLVYGTYQAYLRRTPAYLTQSLLDAKANGYAIGVKLVRGAYHPHEVSAFNKQATASAKHTHDHSAHTHAASLSISPDPHPPVWPTKSETDQCYNECARVLVGAMREDIEDAHTVKQGVRAGGSSLGPRPPALGVLFGTHNWESCDLILEELVGGGLAVREGEAVMIGGDVAERLSMGQLYGMSDDLTDYLANKTKSNTPLIIKYVPYGALSEVMPYLSRRAIENKSVLGDGGAAAERRRAGAAIWKRLFG